MTDKAPQLPTLSLMRGPLIIISVTVFLLLPYLSLLSTETFVCLLLFGLGVLISLHDFRVLLESHLRENLVRVVDSIVLDDILRSIFDPETGWITIFVSAFVGKASMYALPMTQEHRIRLIQSALWTSEEQTKTLLTSPGGIRELFPRWFRNWLDQEEEREEDGEEKSRQSRRECEHSQDDTEETAESDPLDQEIVVEQKTSETRLSRGIHVDVREAPHLLERAREPAGTLSTPTEAPPEFESPLSAIRGILKELAVDILKRTCLSMPDSVLGTIGIAATTGFALHLRSSPRARKIVAEAAEGTVCLSLAVAAMTAIVTLVAKQQVSAQGTRSSGAACAVARNCQLLLESIRRFVPKDCGQWKAALAIIVLFLVGRLRRKPIGAAHHR
jgi:hypothetical protein